MQTRHVIVATSLVLGLLAGCSQQPAQVPQEPTDEAPATATSTEPAPPQGQATAGEGAPAEKKEQHKGILGSKKLSELTEDDLVQAAVALGWGDKPQHTHSKSNSNEIIVVSTVEEDPDGYENPMGQRVAHLRLELNIAKKDAESLQYDVKQFEEKGIPYRLEGNRLLSIKYTTKKGVDKEKSQELMKRLFGE